MSDKNQKYRVTSPIKRGGKLYKANDSILLSEEEAEGLHVVPFDSPAEAGESTAAASAKKSPSTGLGAKQAINLIEGSDLADLEGFVISEEDGGDENRKTVLDAWAAKQSASKKDSPKKS